MTELTCFQRKISALLPEIEIRFSEPLAKHTSFRIGGAAEAMAFPKTAEELSRLLKTSALLDCRPVILGAGTNVLAPDEGMPGLVICLKDCLDGMERMDDTHIRVMAGVTMARAAVFAANQSLSGLEFSHGIPGTVGGGVYMNAGAYGGEISQVCQCVELMDYEGNVRKYCKNDMHFSYRHSILEETDAIVISAEFRLTPGSSEEIWAKMKELIGKRSASQPLDLPSAGSAFKRPVGGFAAALIDQAGFAVNLGGATAGDVKTLLKEVSDKVFETSGIRIEPEIRIW